MSGNTRVAAWRNGVDMSEQDQQDQQEVRNLKDEVLVTKLYLLDQIQTAKNWTQAVSAAQAYALVSGTLTSISTSSPVR